MCTSPAAQSLSQTLGLARCGLLVCAASGVTPPPRLQRSKYSSAGIGASGTSVPVTSDQSHPEHSTTPAACMLNRVVGTEPLALMSQPSNCARPLNWIDCPGCPNLSVQLASDANESIVPETMILFDTVLPCHNKHCSAAMLAEPVDDSVMLATPVPAVRSVRPHSRQRMSLPLNKMPRDAVLLPIQFAVPIGVGVYADPPSLAALTTHDGPPIV